MDSSEKQGKPQEIYPWHLRLHTLVWCLLPNDVLESISVWTSFVNMVYGSVSLTSHLVDSLLSTQQYKTNTHLLYIDQPIR